MNYRSPELVPEIFPYPSQINKHICFPISIHPKVFKCFHEILPVLGQYVDFTQKNYQEN